MRRGYRRIRANLASFAHDLRIPDPIKLERAPMLATLKSYVAACGLGADWKVPETLQEEHLIRTLSVLCPFPPTKKRTLLDAPTEAARAETLLTLLRVDAYTPPSGSAENIPLAG